MEFPKESWKEASPESQGVDREKLNEAMDYLAGVSGQQGNEQAIVIRNGFVIWKGNDIDNLHSVWSVSKSFTSTVLGLLIDQGKCTLDTKASQYLPFLEEMYPDVTLRHLTTMTSGYCAVGNPPGGAGSRTPFIPAKPLYKPGEKYLYNNDGMHILAYALTRIAKEPLKDLFKRHIADRIGIRSWEWRDFGVIDGILVNGGTDNIKVGISTTAEGLARLGHLFLNRGNWDGRQLISAEWVKQATSVQVPADLPELPYLPMISDANHALGSGIYGFNWWVNGTKANGERTWKHAPPGTFYASGYNNNMCCAVPEWNLVFVRLGTDCSVQPSAYDIFWKKLSEALNG